MIRIDLDMTFAEAAKVALAGEPMIAETLDAWLQTATDQ